MKKEHIPLYISILSLTVSGIAIGVSCYRTEKLSMDYMGVIIGILSLLVTALLTWNIYEAIDTRGIKEEYKKLKEEVAFALFTTKIDLFATAVALNKDAIKRVSNKSSQRTDELEFHMIVNYLQLILCDIQAGFMDDAIIHKKTMVRDVRNRTPRLNTRQINMVHRLCGFISAECNNRHIDDIGVTDIFSHIENIDNNNTQSKTK